MGGLNNKVYKYLLSYGFSPVHKGFKIIIDAVCLIIESGFRYKSLNEIYAPLSENYNISVYGIQKNIKNAIDYANLKCGIDFFMNEFGGITKGSGISCASFLCYVAGKMQYG